MSNKHRNFWRTTVQVLALGVFLFLLAQNRLTLWVLLFGAAALLSVVFGRFYCSWICPMNSSFRVIQALYDKLAFKRHKTPKIFKNPVIRGLVLVVFVGTMVIMKKRNIPVNMLLYITLASILITLFFEEAFWHRRLCPFGTILNITSRKSRFTMRVDKEVCIACGKCQKGKTSSMNACSAVTVPPSVPPQPARWGGIDTRRT
jgi:polyferredoxin